MDFRQIRIPYEGRERFKSNNGNSSVRSLINQYFGGSSTGGDAGYGGAENRGGNGNAFYAFLSQYSWNISGLQLAATSMTETVYVYGYRNMEDAQTLIGDLSASGASLNYGIQGIPNTGMYVQVQNNGTTGTSIQITVDNTLTANQGTLTIPVNVNINDNPLDPYEQVWAQNINKVMTINLSWSWKVDRGGSSSYVMDLSNEKAAVNVSAVTAQGDILYPNSIATLTCSASTFIGTELVQGVSYSIFTQPQFHAQGLTISTEDNKGLLHWASNFNFDGPTLPIDIIATLSGNNIATKTMTVDKNYPGQDGSAAITRWIVTDYSEAHFNPNTSALTPTAITAYVIKQVGGDEPIIDTATTIYYWYSSLPNSRSPLPSTGATVYPDEEAIFFGLKNSDEVWYEIETVYILKDGWNGEDGQPGASGAPGTNGVDGKSAWYLTLTNDNASINCDASGHILTNTIKPTCKVKLYYGDDRVTNASYKISGNTPYTGVTTANSSGILTISFNNNTFNFNEDVLTLSISGYSGTTSTEVRDVKTMNIVKAYAGAPGEDGTPGADAVSYWLEPSYTEIIFNPNTNTCDPTSITCGKYKQVGEQAPTTASDATIKYSWQYRSDGTFTTESNFPSTGVNVTTANCNTYKRLRLILYVGSAQMDMEDIDILKDGLDGTTAGQGRTGAAIRGPYDYYAVSTSTRCWCAGESSSTCTDCDKWIDVILKDGVYYYCNTTYYGKLSPWNNVSGYWTAGEDFDFVAARLIMAQNASIDFLTNNELYLKNSNNEITAGAAGGNGINFWAGADSPSNAPFQVNNDGTMVATKGTFGPFTIGTDEAGTSSLRGIQSASTYDGKWKYDAYINPENTHFTGQLSADTGVYTESVSIAPYRNLDKYDGNATIEVLMDYKKSTSCGDISPEYTENKAFSTNGVVFANHFDGPVIAGEDVKLGSAVMSLLPTEIIYITDDSSLFTTCGTWYINGQDTGIDGSEPVGLFRYSNYTWWFGNTRLTDMGVCITGGTATPVTGGTPYWHFNGVNLGLRSDTHPNLRIKSNATIPGQNGYWEVYAAASNYMITGIGSNSANFIRRNNVIYIEL